MPSIAVGQTFEQQVLERVNQQRWLNGQLPPFKYNAALAQAAEGHSERMAVADFVDHDDPVFGSITDRICAASYLECTGNAPGRYEVIDGVNGFWAIGENIAWGYTDTDSVIDGWMNSDGHRRNILSDDFCEIGVGYYAGGSKRHYWTQNFGCTSTASYFVIINRESYATTSRSVALYLVGASVNEIRIRNAGGPWTDWQPFTNQMNWQLSGHPGTHTVEVEMRIGNALVRVSDTIMLAGGNLLFRDDFD